VQLAIQQYRIQADVNFVPLPVLRADPEFDRACAEALESVADKVCGRRKERRRPDLVTACARLEGRISVRAHGIVTLAQQLVMILNSVLDDVHRIGVADLEPVDS
jgi:hypothetical protein